MKYKIENPKRTIIFFSAIFLVIAAVVFGIVAWKKYKFNHDPKNQPRIYEALVQVRDQKASDPAEDARGSLKAGDVIAIFPAGHPWSETEKVSYLIVKIKITPNEADKLVAPATKEVGLPKSKGNPTSKMPQTQMETILARAYRLNLPSFDINKFYQDQQQPFSDKVFDDSIIGKK